LPGRGEYRSAACGAGVVGCFRSEGIRSGVSIRSTHRFLVCPVSSLPSPPLQSACAMTCDGVANVECFPSTCSGGPLMCGAGLGGCDAYLGEGCSWNVADNVFNSSSPSTFLHQSPPLSFLLPPPPPLPYSSLLLPPPLSSSSLLLIFALLQPRSPTNFVAFCHRQRSSCALLFAAFCHTPAQSQTRTCTLAVGSLVR